MLSALLGAICAASLAFAPVSASASVNADLTPTVHGAYYEDGGAYGSTASQIYNYTSKRIIAGEDDGFCGGSDFVLGIENNTQISIWDNHLQIFEFNNFYTLEPDYVVQEDNSIRTLTENDCLDVYVNGNFLSTLYTSRVDENVPYSFSISAQGISASDYIWLFDHQGYQLGTDTVADIAEGLTSGIGTVATGIGGGLQSLMQNIFLVGTVDDETGAFTATGLSTFGVVTVVFCGLALALGLSRWIVGFASSLGSRNR